MENKIVEIQDMYLAAALLSYGYKYYGVDKSEASRQRFLFEDSFGLIHCYINSGDIKDDGIVSVEADVRDVEKFYISKQLLFPPEYPQSIRDIKYIIHSKDDDDGKKRTRTGSFSVLPRNPKASSIG